MVGKIPADFLDLKNRAYAGKRFPSNSNSRIRPTNRTHFRSKQIPKKYGPAFLIPNFPAPVAPIPHFAFTGTCTFPITLARMR